MTEVTARRTSIRIRPFREKDLAEALDLIKRSDSTDRSTETWRGNRMTAVLAFDGTRLIGIIPFEPRDIVVPGRDDLKTLWLSAVHVEPEYRNRGIGTQMEEKISEFFGPEFDALLVCREDESSPAFRWYQKRDYRVLAAIVSLKQLVRAGHQDEQYTLLSSKQHFKDNGSCLLDCFERNQGECGGYPKRTASFWSDKFIHHYYKKFYKYMAVVLKEQDKILSYAFLGKTAIRDHVDRLDILEWAWPQTNAIKEKMLSALNHCAVKCGVRELRVQASREDKDLNWFKRAGFSRRWETNLLGKPISAAKALPEMKWKFFQVDYI